MAARKRKTRIREPRAAYVPLRRRARASAPRGGTTGDWAWLQANRRLLEEKYAGRWVAVHERKVVSSGRQVEAVLKKAKKQGAEHPLVMAFRPRRLQDAAEVAH